MITTTVDFLKLHAHPSNPPTANLQYIIPYLAKQVQSEGLCIHECPVGIPYRAKRVQSDPKISLAIFFEYVVI